MVNDKKFNEGFKRMKVAVLGAGAMGSLYGAKLSCTQDVTMVDKDIYE